MHRDGSGGMAQVPQGQGTGQLGNVVDRRHVHDGTGAVIDAGKAYEAHVVGDHFGQCARLNAFDGVCFDKTKHCWWRSAIPCNTYRTVGKSLASATITGRPALASIAATANL